MRGSPTKAIHGYEAEWKSVKSNQLKSILFIMDLYIFRTFNFISLSFKKRASITQINYD